MRKFIAPLLAVAVTASVIVADAPAQARAGLQVGVTVRPAEYASMLAEHQNIASTRVFFAGLPSWDWRIAQLAARGIVPFVSWKTHDVQAIRRWLLSIPPTVPRVYLAEFHEPEADMPAATYRARQVQTWRMITALPRAIRARVRFGPVQTKQWTENGARSYAEYDPGIGDFWGVDAYANSWGGQTAAAYPDPARWLRQIQAYNTCRYGYCRRKWIPEFGAVSRCQDVNDFGRALWLSRVIRRLEADRRIGLVLWWNTEGTAGTRASCLGTRRNFRLDQQTVYSQGAYATTTPSPPATKRIWTDFMQRNTP